MRKPRDSRHVDGVLLLDKPQGVGSNAALQHVRRLYRAERAGHTGTLDPMASGLLAICLGEATKFSGELLGAAKTYRASIALGVRTSTGDALGSVLSERPVNVVRDEIEAALARFRGDVLQVPPMYSAIKRQGRPLYSYARQGKFFDLDPRPVTIHSLDLVSFHDTRVEIVLSCSKGTYVRALADDIGEALGCGAHLCGLVRTRIGAFVIEHSHTPSDLAALTESERDRLLLPADRLLGEIGRAHV
jgi:tRNA pseudouridine55 synthase